jgi:1-acyl-sn-glycerol-3-phosphate acyltransferase
MIPLLRKLHYYLLLTSMGFFFLLFYLPAYYCSIKPERYSGLIKLRRVWTFISTFCVGITFKFEFEEPIDWRKTYIICPLHTSNLDTSMICTLMKRDNFCFMGKQELLDSMVTGIYFRTVDIPVNRDSKMSAFRAFKAAADKLKQGINMIMFPEGGIANDYPPQVQEFKNGPFRLAIECGVPVIPVTSLNTWQHMWDDGAKYGTRPGICKIYIHKPIETAHLSVNDADNLRDMVSNIIKNKFDIELSKNIV